MFTSTNVNCVFFENFLSFSFSLLDRLQSALDKHGFFFNLVEKSSWPCWVFSFLASDGVILIAECTILLLHVAVKLLPINDRSNPSSCLLSHHAPAFCIPCLLLCVWLYQQLKRVLLLMSDSMFFFKVVSDNTWIEWTFHISIYHSGLVPILLMPSTILITTSSMFRDLICITTMYSVKVTININVNLNVWSWSRLPIHLIFFVDPLQQSYYNLSLVLFAQRS